MSSYIRLYVIRHASRGRPAYITSQEMNELVDSIKKFEEQLLPPRVAVLAWGVNCGLGGARGLDGLQFLPRALTH